jgi:hypothetical protein
MLKFAMNEIMLMLPRGRRNTAWSLLVCGSLVHSLKLIRLSVSSIMQLSSWYKIQMHNRSHQKDGNHCKY